MNTLYAAGQAFITAIEPWKGVIASVAGALGATLGIVGGIIKQRRVADTTASDPSPYRPRATAPRLHPDDIDAISGVRSCIGDLRESVEDLARETRRNTKATEDNTEALQDNTGALGVLARSGRRGGRQ